MFREEHYFNAIQQLTVQLTGNESSMIREQFATVAVAPCFHKRLGRILEPIALYVFDINIRMYPSKLSYLISSEIGYESVMQQIE